MEKRIEYSKTFLRYIHTHKEEQSTFIIQISNWKKYQISPFQMHCRIIDQQKEEKRIEYLETTFLKYIHTHKEEQSTFIIQE